MSSFRALKPAPFQVAASGGAQRGLRGNHNLNRPLAERKHAMRTRASITHVRIFYGGRNE